MCPSGCGRLALSAVAFYWQTQRRHFQPCVGRRDGNDGSRRGCSLAVCAYGPFSPSERLIVPAWLQTSIYDNVTMWWYEAMHVYCFTDLIMG